MSDGKFTLVNDPDEALKDYINKNLEWISPFHVSKGYYFQVRIKAEVYESLPKNIKKALNDSSTKIMGNQLSSPDERERWEKENYWTACDAYIFEYEANGYRMDAGIEYEIDGGFDSKYPEYFLNIDNLPFIVWVNRNTMEQCNDFVYPKNGKVYQ